MGQARPGAVAGEECDRSGCEGLVQAAAEGGAGSSWEAV